MKLFAYSFSDWDKATIAQRISAWEKTTIMAPDRLQELQKHYIYPFYSPNFFIRIGLFIFTLFIELASIGLLYLFLGSLLDVLPTQLTFLFLAVMFFGVLEFYIQEKKIYRSGIDDALSYSGIAALVTCLSWYNPLPYDHYPLWILLIALPLLTISSIRYADRLLALCAYLNLTLIIAYLFIQWQTYGPLLLPFVLMFVSFFSYRLTIKKSTVYKLRFWNESFTIVEWLSLGVFYLSGNYFVIRELSQALLPSYTISLPLTIFFYLFTILVPLLYLFFGIKNKNRTLLNTGLITLALAAITITYFWGAQQYALWMITGGVFLIGFAWYSIQKLKHNWHGFSYQPDLEAQHLLEHPELEAYIISNTLSTTPNTTDDSLYGGGSYGGAGAEGQY